MIPRSVLLCLLVLVLGAGGLLLAGGKSGQETTAARMDEASYAGDETCAMCHSEVAEQFGFSMHARLKEWEMRGPVGRSESCHGPGSKHVEESGDPRFIFNFKGKEGREASRPCLSCHYHDHGAEWPGSVHFMAGLGCGDCHSIHQSRQVVTPPAIPLTGAATRHPEMGVIAPAKQGPPRRFSLAKPEAEVCFDCHREKRAQVQYSSPHPIIEGRMSCSSCHAVHGSEEEYMLKATEGVNEMCTSCHPAQQGPFVFEHAAVEEGCTSCHNPHGTLANNLLVQNEPFLCLQCHEAHFHMGREGIDTPINRPSGSVTNQYGSSGWRRAFATKCSTCHASVHGTDLPSQGISGRGGSLTR